LADRLTYIAHERFGARSSLLMLEAKPSTLDSQYALRKFIVGHNIREVSLNVLQEPDHLVSLATTIRGELSDEMNSSGAFESRLDQTTCFARQLAEDCAVTGETK
jgi:hypothetical protein